MVKLTEKQIASLEAELTRISQQVKYRNSLYKRPKDDKERKLFFENHTEIDDRFAVKILEDIVLNQILNIRKHSNKTDSNETEQKGTKQSWLERLINMGLQRIKKTSAKDTLS